MTNSHLRNIEKISSQSGFDFDKNLVPELKSTLIFWIISNLKNYNGK
jgi:hypothetical protein